VVISPSRVSGVVDGMTTLGLVERVACDTDARVSHVVITDAGRATLPKIDQTFQTRRARTLPRSPDAHSVHQLAAIMRRLGTPVEVRGERPARRGAGARRVGIGGDDTSAPEVSPGSTDGDADAERRRRIAVVTCPPPPSEPSPSGLRIGIRQDA